MRWGDKHFSAIAFLYEVSAHYPPCCQHRSLDRAWREHLVPFFVIAMHCPVAVGVDSFAEDDFGGGTLFL